MAHSDAIHNRIVHATSQQPRQSVAGWQRLVSEYRYSDSHVLCSKFLGSNAGRCSRWMGIDHAEEM